MTSDGPHCICDYGVHIIPALVYRFRCINRNNKEILLVDLHSRGQVLCLNPLIRVLAAKMSTGSTSQRMPGREQLRLWRVYLCP